MADTLDQSMRSSLWDYLGGLDGATLRRAQHYATDGRVVSAQIAPDFIGGVVQGASRYRVELSRSGSNWSGSCACPVEIDCKHCGALVIALLNASVSGRGRAPAEVVPFPARPARASFRDTWAPRLAEKLGRPLTEDEAHTLGRLAALFTEFKARWYRLFPDSLLRHGFHVPAAERSSAYEPAYSGWWEEARPPSDPWQLWQYLAVDLELAGREIPEFLRPLTDTAALRARIEERQLEAEVSRWRQMAAPDRVAPSRRETGIAGLQLRWTGSDWQVETQAGPTKPFKPAGRTWLRALGNQIGPEDFAHLPPSQAMLGTLLVAASALGGIGGVGDLDEFIRMALASPLAREAIVLPGGPWQVEAGELAWQAEVAPSRPSKLQFHLVGPDGEAASEAVLVHGGERDTLYYWRERVYRGPRPLPALEAPLRALEDREIRRFLRDRAVRLPASVAARTCQVTFRPRLECSLVGPAGGERNMLAVRLLAVSDDPPCQQERTPVDWQWTESGAPVPRKPGEPFVEYDVAAAEVVLPSLVEFRLSWFQYYGGWVRSLTRNFAEDFVAWRETLPPGVEVVLSPELAGLGAAATRAHLDLEVVPAEQARDWFDVAVALRVEDTTLTREEIALLLKARGKWVRLPRVGFRRVEVSTEGAAADVLDRLGLAAGDVATGGKPARHRLHALQLAGEAEKLGDSALTAALRERAAALTPVSATVPANLQAELRPYQREGFEFLAFLSSNGFGGVLADDMGLGKTVQTLAWLLWLAAQTPPAATRRRASKGAPPAAARVFRALVVCPKSVVHGWVAETARFAPALGATPFTPALADEKTPPAGLTIANYTQLRLQAAWFADPVWDAVVLDEGQFIKNPASKIAGVAQALLSPRRLVLTGTPIENRLLDLWSLFAFAQPGLLGSQAEFNRQYPAGDAAAHARLRRRTRHFMLRRTKSQVATDLPPRTEDDLQVELEPEQAKLYRAELKRARQQLLGVETDRGLDRVRFNILASLLRLRQICCHPGLVDPAHADLPSAKLEALLERLEELRDEGHQVLVFSQFVEMLEIIRRRLVEAEIGHLMLTGATEDRAALVEEFQRDRTRTVFLLSLKAAGFGLNLTAASYAILYDPWWNPAVEAQAIDRTHRIGQTRPVIAYRLLAQDTVEQKIRALQQEKAALAREIVQEESLASVLDLDSLRRILA